jgi:hypothetical protein
METKIIKIALSILFLVCLLHMPYGYYQMVRFLGFSGFALLAYFSFKQKAEKGVIIYSLLALLFQPFIKIVLGRSIWNIVDVIVAAGLLISLFAKQPEKEREKQNLN